MDYANRLRRISNSYYNIGLQRAENRDLSGAAEVLKRSLHFNKYNTDSRNLLGLIYFEFGETADALVQWVISLNLDPRANRAETYLAKLQGKSGYLNTVDQSIKKYNQALLHAQNGSQDLAILQLTKAVDQNRNYIKAHLLLALLYIAHEEYQKAGKSLLIVRQLDRNNAKAQLYLSILEENSGRIDLENKRFKNAFSHRQMQDDDIILPPSYKENTGWQTVINLIVGLGIGVLVIFFLVIPANNRVLNIKHNIEMLAYSESLNQKNLQIDDLNRDLARARRSQEKAEESLDELLNDNGGILNQYQLLVQILEAYRVEDMAMAAKLYVQMDSSVLYDGELDRIVDTVNASMAAQGYQVLQDLGDKAVNAGQNDQAITYYQQSLSIRQENPGVLYQLGLIYKRRGDTDAANAYFGQVIMNYSDSEYAEMAKTERGY